MATTPTPCDLLRERLKNAEAALEALLYGTRLVGVREGDKALDYYAAGNVEALERWIRLLQGRVDACNGIRGAHRGFTFIPN